MTSTDETTRIHAALCQQINERPAALRPQLLFSVLNQETGWEGRPRTDLFCVGWDVNLHSINQLSPQRLSAVNMFVIFTPFNTFGLLGYIILLFIVNCPFISQIHTVALLVCSYFSL